MYPDGVTNHSWPSTLIFLAGISGDLRFVIDPRRIENSIRRIGVRDDQCRLIIGFGEFNERTRKRDFFENVEPAVRRSVMTAAGSHLLEILRSFRSRNRRSL